MKRLLLSIVFWIKSKTTSLTAWAKGKLGTISSTAKSAARKVAVALLIIVTIVAATQHSTFIANSFKKIFVICTLLIVLIISLWFRKSARVGGFAASSVNDIITNWHSNVKDKDINSDGDVIKNKDRFEFFTDLFGLWFMGFAFFPKPTRLDFNIAKLSTSATGIPTQEIAKFEDAYVIPESFPLDFMTKAIELSDGSSWFLQFSTRFETTQARKLHELDKNETWFIHFNGVFNEMAQEFLAHKISSHTVKTAREEVSLLIISALKSKEFQRKLIAINKTLKPKGLQMIIKDFNFIDRAPATKVTVEMIEAHAKIQIAKDEAEQAIQEALGKRDAGIELNKVKKDLLKIENDALVIEAETFSKLNAGQARSLALAKNNTLTTYAEGGEIMTNVGK